MILGFPKSKLDIFTVQKYLIWGHLFLFIVNDRQYPNMRPECFLREDGTVFVLISDIRELASDNESVLQRIFDDDVTKIMRQLQT